jgi:CheY-like chemotaxis protein
MNLTILHIEDNLLVALTVKDTLEFEGCRVTHCADGLAGLRELQSETRYDLLLVDQDVPHIDGWQLIKHARTLKHRRDMPIILFSASDHRAEAERVGVVFLPKPEGVCRLVATIARLLHQAA